MRLRMRCTAAGLDRAQCWHFYTSKCFLALLSETAERFVALHGCLQRMPLGLLGTNNMCAGEWIGTCRAVHTYTVQVLRWLPRNGDQSHIRVMFLLAPLLAVSVCGCLLHSCRALSRYVVQHHTETWCWRCMYVV